MGGLSKKIFQIKSLSKENTANSLLVDSGNLLFKQTNIADGPSQARLAASTIVEVYKTIGFDAVAVGPLDLAGGVLFLQQSKNDNFPWISANIFNENEQLLFKPFVTKTIQDREITVFALSGAPKRALSDVYIKPWEDILPSLLQRIRKKNRNGLIVLLSSLSDKENQVIAKEYKDIHVLVSAHPRKGNVAPQLINNTLLTQTAKQGKHQGLLEITFGSSRLWGQNSQKKLADLQNSLGSINWQLQRLLKKSKPSGNAAKYEKTITRLEDEKKSLAAEINTMKDQADEERNGGTKEDNFTYRFIGLKKNMPNDQRTDEKIHTLNQEVRKLNARLKQAKTANRHITGAKSSLSLIGHNACGECHEKQKIFWESTRHAKAYNTLLTKNKNLDTNCLPCHLSMEITKGAFAPLAPNMILSYPEKLQSVGCETCHGIGNKHSTDPEQFKLVLTPASDICLTCHTDEHDDNFIYKEKLEKVSCPAG